jgi:secreted trypsin-like serine protease
MKTQLLKKTLLASCITVAATSQLQADITNRIIGGIESSAGNYSWIASLQTSDGQHFCGASLIAKQWVMTAAHCVEDQSTGTVVAANTMQVVVGDYNISKADAGEQKRQISQVIVHPQRNANAGDNHDIALLRLSSEVSNAAVTPISSELMKNISTGTALTVMGWGNLSTTGQQYPDKLNEVQVPLVSQAVCNNNYGGGITENMVCAGYTQGGKDSCQGDSGGPLLYQVDNQWHQVGIVSFGNGCAQAGSPGVYARVEKYGTWIADQLKGTGTSTGGTGGTDTGTGTGGTDTGTGTGETGTGGTDTGNGETGTGGTGTDTGMDGGIDTGDIDTSSNILNLPAFIDIFSYDGKAEAVIIPLENSSNSAINISGIRIEDTTFSVDDTACVMTLEPQQKCEITVRYLPSEGQDFTVADMIIDLVDGTNIAVTLLGENMLAWGEDTGEFSDFSDDDFGADFADNTEWDDLDWDDLDWDTELTDTEIMAWFSDNSAWQETESGFALDNSALYDESDKAILELKVAGAGVLSFEIEFENDVNDNSVTYFVDGKAVRTVKGAQRSYIQHSTQLSAGEHRITWAYSKKNAASGQFKLNNVQYKASPIVAEDTSAAIDTDDTASTTGNLFAAFQDDESTTGWSNDWRWDIKNVLRF